MAQTRSLIVKLFALVAMFLTSCVDSVHNEVTPKGPEPQPELEVAYHRLRDSIHVDFVDSVGTIVLPNQIISGYGQVIAEAPLYWDAIYPWKPGEGENLQRDITSLEQENKFNFNYGGNTVRTKISLVQYKGRVVPRWPGDDIILKATSLKVDENPHDGLYYAETSLVYGMVYLRKEAAGQKEIKLSEDDQLLIAQENFKDEYLGLKVLRQSHQFGSGVYDAATGILTCVDTLFYAESWKSGLKNEAFVLVHMQNHIHVATSGNIVVDLSKTVGNSWTGNQANLGGFVITETWQSKNIREDKLEAVVNGQTFNLKDSVQHICRWNPDGGKVESAKKVRLDFAREGVPTDKCKAYKDVDIKQRTIVDVVYSFWHKAFNKKAVISGKTLTVTCNNGAKFQPKFDDNTLGQVEEGNFLETLAFNLSHPDLVAPAAKGKTYSVDANGKVTVEGQVWSITFASRTIQSIPYNGKDYKNDPKVPKCPATPTTIYFCSDCDSVEYTLKHESEIIKGREKIPYNYVVDYKVLSEHHESWGQISSSNGTWTLPCSNYVLVVPIYKDGTQGEAERMSYAAYNNWKMTKMLEVEVTNPSDYVNVTVQIMDGKASVAGGEAIFAHTMAANKVTKGSWSYQPGNCPADATYFTPISEKEARVDVYHSGSKVGSFIVPISLLKKLAPITINGQIVRIDRTHAYQNQHGSYEGTYWHILAKLADGSYIDYVIREESYNKNLSLQQNMKEYKLSASEGDQIVNSGEAVALIWTGSNWVVGTVTSEDGKAAVGAYIEYHYQGQLAYTLGNGTGTHSQGNQGFPNAILGSWTTPSADGTWPLTIAGQKIILQGS